MIDRQLATLYIRHIQPAGFNDLNRATIRSAWLAWCNILLSSFAQVSWYTYARRAKDSQPLQLRPRGMVAKFLFFLL